MSDPVLQKKILRSLLKFLPLVSEEGGIRSRISKIQLIAKINEDTEIDKKSIISSIDLIELILQKLGCLDSYALSDEQWEFVSFPSALLSRSWLSMLADEKSNYFTDGWWSDQMNTEKQRELISFFESKRVQSDHEGKIAAIRTVFVAWALIKLEGRILFCEREDKKREDTPHYVLAGGRLNIDDLKKYFNRADKEYFLKILNTENSKEAHQALKVTLERELLEELGIKKNQYQAKEQYKLKPFYMLAGDKANFSYTRYEIDLFEVSLNFDGLKQISSLENNIFTAESLKNQISWFTVDEVIKAQKNNQRAFIDAWKANYDYKDKLLKKDLSNLDESYEDQFELSEKIDLLFLLMIPSY